MGRLLMRTVPVASLLAVLFFGNGFGLLSPTSHSMSETSAVSAAPQPTATYVSELGPAVVAPPRQPFRLPSTGASEASDTPWPKAAGLGLALLGLLLIHTALSLRPNDAG